MTAIVAVVGVLGILLLVSRWALHRSFRVQRLPPSSRPQDLGLTAKEFRIPTARGKTLWGCLIAAPSSGPAPAVVAMHGWGADHSSLLPLIPALNQAGMTVLLVDARNHGRSDGDTFSSMPRFAEDIGAALDWLARHAQVDQSRLAVLGHSVGGGAALLAASRRADIRAVVSLSAFDHPERVMRDYLRRLRIPYRPWGWLACRYVERVIGHRFDHIAPVSTVTHVRCPILIGHGAADDTVPVAAAQAIHAAAAGKSQLRILENTGHDHAEDYHAIGRIVAGFLVVALAHTKSR